MIALRALAAACAAAAMLAPAAVAGADPPGPTDYETTVLGIEPATPELRVDIIGGDSFVQLSVDRGTQIVVRGYSGEPYLRFDTDGTVEENLLSRLVPRTRTGTATSRR